MAQPCRAPASAVTSPLAPPHLPLDAGPRLTAGDGWGRASAAGDAGGAVMDGGAQRGGAPHTQSAPVPLPKTRCFWGADPKGGVTVTPAVLGAPWHLGTRPHSVAPVTSPHLLLPQPWVPPDPAEGPKATAHPSSITVASRREGSVGGGGLCSHRPRGPAAAPAPSSPPPSRGIKPPRCAGGAAVRSWWSRGRILPTHDR